MTMTHTAQATGAWEEHLQSLRGRYPKVKESILFSFHALTLNPDIEIEALKDLAEVHEIRVTRASLNAAKTLLARASTAPTPKVKETVHEATDGAEPRARRPRAVEPAADTDALVRGLVGKLQARSSAEADKLREAMRKAIATLTAAVGA